MSNKLALSAALSVLMMAAYVLFSADAAHAPLSEGGSGISVEAVTPQLPEFMRYIPGFH